MLKIKYVIRSGDGFLVCPKTLKMVANRSDPSVAAIEAKRYNLPLSGQMRDLAYILTNRQR